MQPGSPPSHSLFIQPSSSSSKRPSTRSSSKSSPPAKKQRTSKTPSPTKEEYRFELPDNTPKTIKRDISKLLTEATERDKAPFRLAYPWSQQRACYAPTSTRTSIFSNIASG
ncbi:hypothetical protein V7S43_010192 [Phytophthora oleae]|uniref:Uncharacterized protein n=1 Tax=Phytophthora oleae TaxID=2107226 RepID=A0ABD3FGK2_9STRA